MPYCTEEEGIIKALSVIYDEDKKSVTKDIGLYSEMKFNKLKNGS